MGRGFWILDNITSLRQNGFASTKTTPHLFKPDATIRYRYPMIRSQNSYPKYPRTSVFIDYYLPEASKEGVKLEILSAKRELIATILSDSTQLKSTVEEVDDMNLSQTFRYVNKKLESKKGLNRFAWDLRQKGAWDKEVKKRYKNGPLVAPGTYLAKLSVNGETYEQAFEIVMDPKIVAEGLTEADIQTQLAMQLQVRDLLTKAKILLSDLEKESKTLKSSSGHEERKVQIEAVVAELKNQEGAYPQQMLVSQISYLYNMISGADQLLGQDAPERFQELKTQLDAIHTKLKL